MAAVERPDGSSYEPTEDCKPSEEKMALMDFAFRLGSCNYTNEQSGIVDEEGNTRNDAKLLMSLLSAAAPPPKVSQDDSLDPISASESEASLSSDSSCSRRDNNFRFTCPSLSLESPDTPSLAHPNLRSNASPTAQRRLFDVVESKKTVVEESPTIPAKLLGRPLNVDDRDALRLSADAMARNIRQSFQKALEWRIQAWVVALSKALVVKEQAILNKGALQEDLRGLLETCEARLILQLRQVAEVIKVTATGTSFQVLGQCRPLTMDEDGEPLAKRLRLDQPAPDLEEGDYQYKVSHVLMMECVISLRTPAGFSEVTLQVPGSIEGTFLSSETCTVVEQELKSIVIQLDTDILAAMVEKSCRTIVRTSVEVIAAKDETEDTSSSNEEEVEFTDIATPTHHCLPGRIVTATDVRAALVTPRGSALFSDSNANHDSLEFASPKPMLLPIPDNFGEHCSSSSSGLAGHPRRISPQPHVPYSEFVVDRDSSHFTTTTPQTPFPSLLRRTSPSLVSPPFNEAGAEYHSVVPENKGPSLPMLVEAACRVMLDTN